jgi:hypothetical protein
MNTQLTTTFLLLTILICLNSVYDFVTHKKIVQDLQTNINKLEETIKEKDDRLQALEKFIKEGQERRAIVPLPVCRAGERHSGCRTLAADEMGATVRGAREDKNED